MTLKFRTPRPLFPTGIDHSAGWRPRTIGHSENGMNANDATGVLAIWNDVAPGREAEFEYWFKSEHLAERLSVPGFRLGRRFEALEGSLRYFVYYLTDTPAVLPSPAYLTRLDGPTQLTRTMMTEVFRNMHRTLCRRAERRGALSGAQCATARFDTLPAPDALEPWLSLHERDGVASCELWSAVNTPVAEEERLRGGDRRIGGCLVAQTLRETDAMRVAGALRHEFGTKAEVGIYRLLCEREAESA